MILKTYYRNDDDPAVMAGVLQEFVLSLSGFPDWAVQQAFNTWSRTNHRRPTPGEIVILAGRALDPLTTELARRDRLAAEAAEAEAERKRTIVDPEVADRIMAEAGFTRERLNAFKFRPMATTFAEAEAPDPTALPVGDWPSALAKDDYRVKALHRARSQNELIMAGGYQPPVEGQQGEA